MSPNPASLLLYFQVQAQVQPTEEHLDNQPVKRTRQ